MLVIGIGGGAIDVYANLVDNINKNPLKGREEFLLWNLQSIRIAGTLVG